jgi:hypothetical protein
MECAKDHGVLWRKKFTRLIDEANLDILLTDPTDKPGEHIGENQAYQVTLQKNGQFQELQEYVHHYRHLDLSYTDKSDFVVVVVDPEIPQWGTANELYLAEHLHKPLFVVCEGGMHTLPRWLFGVINHIEDGQTNVYRSIEEVVAELVDLDKGEKPLSSEWVLIHRELERQRDIRRSKANLFPV